MDFSTLAERIGFPAAILIVFAFALWRVLVWVGAKVVIPVTESHIDLVKETKEANKINTEANRLNAEANKQISQAVATHTKVFAEFVESFKK